MGFPLSQVVDTMLAELQLRPQECLQLNRSFLCAAKAQKSLNPFGLLPKSPFVAWQQCA
jgi:hypothetical protein